MTRRAWTLARLTAVGLGIGLSAGAPAPAIAQAPGPESFAKVPKTPLELWDAVDYLVRTGQAGQSVPYLDAFLKSNPDDATLLSIRDRYGAGSILRLEEYPETKSRAKPLLDLLAAASKRNSTDAGRLARFVGMLTKTNEEQRYGVDRLREAGPAAVPVIVDALSAPNLGAEDRHLLVANLGRLDSSAVPPLVATLDAEDGVLAADAADALGRIGDPRAIAPLTIPASRPGDTPRRLAARAAIARLTGSDFDAQGRSPIRVLTDEARKYQLHRVAFPGESVGLWAWDGGRPGERVASKAEAEAALGLKFARAALDLDPASRDAQVALVSLALNRSVNLAGSGGAPGRDPAGAFAAALSAGPGVLGEVARRAMADGQPDLATAALLALGRVANRDVLADDAGRLNVLVAGLSDPDRRVRFAAARSLVDLAPSRPFPGSSRVVPVLASFVAAQSRPKVVVVDGNAVRGNGVGDVFRDLGYEFSVATTGAEGFRLAAEGADVEAVLVEPTLLDGAWRLADLLRNLRADPATAGLPVLLYGPQRLGDRLGPAIEDAPRTAFVVTPTDAASFRPTWDRTLGRLGARPLAQADREGLARAAAALLAEVGGRPGNPFEGNVSEAEPALAVALNNPPTSLAATAALGDIPGAPAQRALADALLDPSRPTPGRLAVADQLSKSLQRFGRQLTDDQQRRLAAELDGAADPAIRDALGEVVGSLRPSAGQVGRRLRRYNPPGPTSLPAAPPSGGLPAAPDPAADGPTKDGR